MVLLEDVILRLCFLISFNYFFFIRALISLFYRFFFFFIKIHYLSSKCRLDYTELLMRKILRTKTRKILFFQLKNSFKLFSSPAKNSFFFFQFKKKSSQKSTFFHKSFNFTGHKITNLSLTIFLHMLAI